MAFRWPFSGDNPSWSPKLNFSGEYLRGVFRILAKSCARLTNLVSLLVDIQIVSIECFKLRRNLERLR